MADQTDIESGAYEVLRARLDQRASDLEERLDALNAERCRLFGAIPFELRATERISTENNCTPRDMVALGGGLFLFGFNVHIGLRTQTTPSDVFACYRYEERVLHDMSLELLGDEAFEADFLALYKYYRETIFAKFSVIDGHLFMVFRVGKAVTDVKTFKWRMDGGRLHYLGNRSDHEYRFPEQQPFEWKRAHRDLHRAGKFPHVSIEERLFVETTGGDLTIKVEDNTDTGAGILSEPVENADQTLDDAEIFYALLGPLILLRIRPYQEEAWRHFIYNEKTQQVVRADELGGACALLPDEHGLIFPGSIYLLLGGLRRYPNMPKGMVLERHVMAPNGEDHLFVFYERLRGQYLLMAYNLIEQSLQTPAVCNGLTLFDGGELLYFREEPGPQKHHAVQIWQTPFTREVVVAEAVRDHFLAKVGNAPVVRAMAECRELLILLRRREAYAGLYIDVARKAQSVADAYFWIGDAAAYDLKSVLLEIGKAAEAAIDEFEKVTRARQRATEAFATVEREATSAITRAEASRIEDLRQFVELLTLLRQARGEAAGLREIKYTDPEAVGALEQSIAEAMDALSQRCVEFLLGERALAPYLERIEGHEAAVQKLTRTAEANRLEGEINETSQALDLLNEIVGNLRIEDPTQATAILNRIAGVYAPLKQVRTELRRRRTEMGRVEAAAHFAAQLQLLEQSAANLLDLCEKPEQCDDGLAKVLLQIEEMEGQFAEFDDYLAELNQRRDTLFGAFEARRVALVEAKNKRANTLLASADRVLQGVEHRLAQCATEAELNTHFTSDLMVDRVRQLVRQLGELGDSVKAEELLTRLETTRQSALRQISDKADLFSADGTTIQLGRHAFNVNRQPLELTLLPRDGGMQFHITGTRYFLPVRDGELEELRAYWDRELPSESDVVARAETLAYLMLRESVLAGRVEGAVVRAHVAARLPELLAHGYAKGVHDEDAIRIIEAAMEIRAEAGLLAYPPRVRAAAILFERAGLPQHPDLTLRMESLSAREAAVGVEKELHSPTLEALEEALEPFVARLPGLAGTASDAGRYLLEKALQQLRHPATNGAGRVAFALLHHLRDRQRMEEIERLRTYALSEPGAAWELMVHWMETYLRHHPEMGPCAGVTIGEAAAHLVAGELEQRDCMEVSLTRELEGMRSEHGCFPNGHYHFAYDAFQERVGRFVREELPAFGRLQQVKRRLVEERRVILRLEEFKAAVLTSFVRNRLIDRVYLPFIGDNLAKQIGAAGPGARTDRMGMLLLISPPGYGKTTLMEYVADRLGITLVKINGPSLGTGTTSLDPAAAPDAGARQEILKLNLAFEMGDNVMIYVDDIQHCHPEFLQKFISLCDGTRRIEGVIDGEPRMFNLRGRKVAVVMAGNPYTESGDQFKIPDMLANRADTYNLGDIVGTEREAFELSYLENALTSNPTLAPLAARHREDLYEFIRVAGEREGGVPPSLKGNWSAGEAADIVGVIRKLLRIRDVLLKVNAAYIASAAQADDYRSEPPFKLQGSYRNMNRLAERVAPVMNEEEVGVLIMDHYQREAQTLTTGAEANLLKFKELIGILTEEERRRWEEIRATFNRNQRFAAVDTDDPVGRVVVQLDRFGEGIHQIGATLRDAVAHRGQPGVLLKVDDPGTVADFEEASISRETLAQIWELVQSDRKRKAAAEDAPASVEDGSE